MPLSDAPGEQEAARGEVRKVCKERETQFAAWKVGAPPPRKNNIIPVQNLEQHGQAPAGQREEQMGLMGVRDVLMRPPSRLSLL